jgi:hypothetical protein
MEIPILEITNSKIQNPIKKFQIPKMEIPILEIPNSKNGNLKRFIRVTILKFK